MSVYYLRSRVYLYLFAAFRQNNILIVCKCLLAADIDSSRLVSGQSKYSKHFSTFKKKKN